MKLQPIRTRVFKEREDLAAFVRAHIKSIPEKSVIAVASKVVALSEGRTAPLGTKAAKEKLIRAESERAIKTELVWMTIKDGMVVVDGGIDESNADNKYVLLPKDSFKAARALRAKLRKAYGVKELGVIITDSRIMPLRAGVVGLALGYSGFKGIRDYRGKPDIFGRPLKYTQTDVADGLATAAVVLTGEGAEQTPLALITHAPVEFRERDVRDELRMPLKDDLYRPFFRRAGL